MRINDRITAKTAAFGVIGKPIRHSLSPQIHNTLAEILGLDITYAAYEAEPEMVRQSFEGLFASGVCGLNVTMPFKGEAFAFADKTHGDTGYFEAANTLVREADGLIHAYSTDLDGFVNSFAIQTGKSFDGLSVVILGAGASCRTLAYAIAKRNAKQITIASRSDDKAAAIVAQFGTIFKNCRFLKIQYSDHKICDIIGASDVIVNTTPVGMNTSDKVLPGDIIFPFQPAHFVVDLIYQPRETYFIRCARAAGATAFNGLGMLICQGALAFELFTGAKVSDRLLREMFESFEQYRPC